MSQLLSKSKYLNGLRCPKYLWLLFNEPERVPAVDAATQYRFDQGHLIGELAKRLFPGGIDIPNENFAANLRQTRELLEGHAPLFEAGIGTGKIYARADILNPVGKDEWDIIEVKSSTSVKDEHIDDVSFQKFCYEKSGLVIHKSFLAYVNNGYVRNGEIDPRQLFHTEDISEQVAEASPGIQERVDSMFDIISAEQCPDTTIGNHCKVPYDCPLQHLCRDFLPENSVFDLYRGGKKSLELFESGVFAIKDIPDYFKLTDIQQIQKECEISGEHYIDREEIRRFLETLKYPLYYLDFETIGPAIPLFNGVRPYQGVPFQFSVHIVHYMQSKPEHYSYLTSGTGDPRLGLLAELQKVLGDSGSVIAYNKGFEEGCLKDMAAAFPEYSDWIGQVCSRLVDLLEPFRNFHYYHPAQKGSASLKAVLPAVTGKGYEDLDISDGQVASFTFLAATYGEMPEEDRTKVIGDLEQYCGRDTEGMIWIVERLRELSD